MDSPMEQEESWEEEDTFMIAPRAASSSLSSTFKYPAQNNKKRYLMSRTGNEARPHTVWPLAACNLQQERNHHHHHAYVDCTV